MGEYQAAAERVKMYDQDVLNKAKRIKEQQIEMKAIEDLLHNKTKEISNILAELDKSKQELRNQQELVENMENIVSDKEGQLEELRSVLSQSENHKILLENNGKISKMQSEIESLKSQKKLWESNEEEKKCELLEKENIIDNLQTNIREQEQNIISHKNEITDLKE